MTTVDPAEVKLAALSLFEAIRDKDDLRRGAILDAFEPWELVTGFIGITAALFANCAASNGLSMERVIEAHRAMFTGEKAAL